MNRPPEDDDLEPLSQHTRAVRKQRPMAPVPRPSAPPPVDEITEPAPPPPAKAAPDQPATAAPKEEEGGPKGAEPTRFGDWEVKGRCIDF